MLTAELFHLAIPFRRPFGHALATRERAEALVLAVSAEGAAGTGECVPRVYVTGESFDSAWRALTQLPLDELWRAVDRSAPAALVASAEALRLAERSGLAAACAVELALLDLACRLGRWRFADLAFAMELPAELVERARPLDEVISVPLDFTREPAELAALLAEHRGLGHLKIKVGGDLERDVRRLRECRQLFGSSLSMSVDANMAWSFEEAMRAAHAFRPFWLRWFEEPLRQEDRPRYRELRERAGIAVMLDEAACSPAQTEAAIAARWCDLVNIRLSKCGGFLGALRVAALAHRAGMRFQHGCQVGQLGFLNAAGRAFTSSVRGLVACEGGPGLDNLADHPGQRRLQLDWQAGHLVGLDGDGHGLPADADKLARYSLRRARWDGARWS